MIRHDQQVIRERQPGVHAQQRVERVAVVGRQQPALRRRRELLGINAMTRERGRLPGTEHREDLREAPRAIGLPPHAPDPGHPVARNGPFRQEPQQRPQQPRQRE